MNIFILDEDPKRAAEYHCDKHVCKMILESGQMLCTAHWIRWLNHLGKSRKDFRLVRDMQNYLYANIPVWTAVHFSGHIKKKTQRTAALKLSVGRVAAELSNIKLLFLVMLVCIVRQ